MPSLFIMSGEASGDLYGSLLTTTLKKNSPEIDLSGVGGVRMQKAGVRLIERIENLSVMGFTDIPGKIVKFIKLRNMILRNISHCQALILIDFPDFNLRLAKTVKSRYPHIKIFYLIPPQVWIWRASRIDQIKKYCNMVFPLFDFEQTLYEKAGVSSYFFGHPISDILSEKIPRGNSTEENQLSIGLLPGSRKQEIIRILPIMLKSVKSFSFSYKKDIQVYIGKSPDFSDDFYLSYFNVNLKNITLTNTHEVLNKSEIVLSKSGTVNLEISYFEKSCMVIYKTSWINYLIAKYILKLKWISLINILSKRQVVKEFIQNQARPENIVDELNRIISDKNYISEMTHAMRELNQKIFSEISVSDQIAKVILQKI